MAGPETLWGLCGRGGMEGSPAPGVAGVDEGQLLPVEQILQQLSIVPEGGLVQQPANTHHYNQTWKQPVLLIRSDPDFFLLRIVRVLLIISSEWKLE